MSRGEKENLMLLVHIYTKLKVHTQNKQKKLDGAN